MKKFISLFILTALLTSCGTQPGTQDMPNTPETTESSNSASETTAGGAAGTLPAEDTDLPVVDAPVNAAYDVELDCGVTVTIGAEAVGELKKLTDKLGKETDFMEAPSCVHPGNDKVYTFDGFTVTSSPDANGNEYIAEVTFTSDAVGFSNGVMIGSPDVDVTEAFGKDFEEKFGVRTYSTNGVKLTFTFTDGAASAISVSAAQ